MLNSMVCSLFAVPYTTMGQLRAPDAYVLPHKSAELTFTNYFRRETDFVGLTTYKYVPMGMVNIGLFDRIGVGAWAGDKVGFVNLKAMIIEETSSIPQVAIGIDNLFSRVGEDANDSTRFGNENWFDYEDKTFYERNSPYLVFTKASVIRGLSGVPLLESYISLGVGRNKFKGQVDLAKRFEGIFGAITIKPRKNISITFENDGGNINAGAQYSIKKFGFKISYVGIEEQENNRFGIAVSYLFDQFADTKHKRDILSGNESITESEIVKSKLSGSDINASSDLLEELKKLREQREQAQKVLDELRKQLEALDEESKSN